MAETHPRTIEFSEILESENDDYKWAVVPVIFLSISVAIIGCAQALANCLIQRAAMENGYIQVPVNGDSDQLRWVKEDR